MAVRDDINVILDVFGGVDGGVGFARLIHALDDIEQRSLGDDRSEAVASIQLLEIVTRFRRLCDTFTK